MRIVTLNIGVILLADFVKGAFPEIESVGQHVGLAAKGQLLVLIALAGEIKRKPQTALDAPARVDAFLQGHFVLRAFKNKSARARVQPFVIFADHDEIDVLGSLVLERAESLVVELHGPKVDVLLQFEARAQQDAFFQDARLYLRMANGAEQNGRELPEFPQDAIGKNFA